MFQLPTFDSGQKQKEFPYNGNHLYRMEKDRAIKLYLDVIPPVLHFSKVHSIRTIIHIVRRYPLVSVMSSLSRNPNNLHPRPQINLQPLVMIVMAGRPGPHQPTTACTVKSGQPGRMVSIPLRWGCHGRILNTAILNSNRTVVKPFWNKIDCPSCTGVLFCRLFLSSSYFCTKFQ